MLQSLEAARPRRVSVKDSVPAVRAYRICIHIYICTYIYIYIDREKEGGCNVM